MNELSPEIEDASDPSLGQNLSDSLTRIPLEIGGEFFDEASVVEPETVLTIRERTLSDGSTLKAWHWLEPARSSNASLPEWDVVVQAPPVYAVSVGGEVELPADARRYHIWKDGNEAVLRRVDAESLATPSTQEQRRLRAVVSELTPSGR